ncbi:MAG: glycosyltransferase family 9 protein [Caulobacteraceae bacterium]
MKTPGVTFYSLQKGEAAEAELAEVKAGGWDGPDIVDWANHLHDVADTAALMECMDLVISVDTSMAHLAGALARPVWILNRYDSCWRWLQDRPDSPWYPTARLFRQSRFDDWTPVIAEVAQGPRGPGVANSRARTRRLAEGQGTRPSAAKHPYVGSATF